MSLGPVLAHPYHRRAATRYKLRLPVVFYWGNNEEHSGAGFTSDVALDGALISSNKYPPVGTTVRIEVLMPSPGDAELELRVECTGKVTRVVDSAGGGFFGVQGSFDDDHLSSRVFH